MRGSNSIEGYDVSLDDALALLQSDDEPLDADQRTVLEVTGYRNAMTYVQQLADDPDFHFDQSLVRSLHFMMLGHDLDKSPGSYRRGPIFVQDEDRGEIVYEGPDSDHVPGLMAELLGFVLGLLPSLLGYLLSFGAGWVLVAIGSVIAGVVSTTFLAAATVALYLDIRVRREGIDLQLLIPDLFEAEPVR